MVRGGSPPLSLTVSSGICSIVGPAPSNYEKEGVIMAVNKGFMLCDPDVIVSKHSEVFEHPFDCLMISGDTWAQPWVTHWRINSPNSGIYALLVAKRMGFDDIRIYGMPADYEVESLSIGGPDKEVLRESWSRYRDQFDNVKVFGGNLPKWFPELR